MPMIDEPITMPFLLNSKEVGLLLQLKPETVEKMRMQGRGPEYIKLGEGTRAPVRYTLESLYRYIQNSVPESEELEK